MGHGLFLYWVYLAGDYSSIDKQSQLVIYNSPDATEADLTFWYLAQPCTCRALYPTVGNLVYSSASLPGKLVCTMKILARLNLINHRLTPLSPICLDCYHGVAMRINSISFDLLLISFACVYTCLPHETLISV